MSSHALDVTVQVEDARIASAVAKALAVEVSDVPPRTHVDVKAEGSLLRLHFEAEEPRGLRAAVHSYLRWADTAIAIARRAVS